ncbi:MAG: F0F1 ATP synthase subunit delta [Campylobacterales bacterium]|nr:F0F1 ATP synthase subunit delta [Campylobacterales bacterium]
MNDIIAKKYAKALISTSTEDKLEEYANSIKKIAEATTIDKFKSIIYSPDVSEEDKTKLLNDIIGECDEKMRNFINALSYHKRFDIFVELYNELKQKISSNKNQYVGYVDSSSLLNEEELKQLNNSFSKKVNSEIILIQRKSDYDGIKVEIDELGIEIGFSKTKLENQMIDFIVKAI